MKGRFITANAIAAFERHLIFEERSGATAEKYIRDAKAFSRYAQSGPVTKETVIAYKKRLRDNYSVRSVNSMLTSLNVLFSLMGWHDLKVKSVSLQQQAFCSEEKELTKAEYTRLCEAARHSGNERLCLVLQKENNKILVISDKALDYQRYNETYENITWEQCSLREWLNDSFLYTAFSKEERALIQSTTVSADKNPQYSTDPGNATTDKVFLLSINEAEKYFSGEQARKCTTTAYVIAIAQSEYDNKYVSWWWLRSPGDKQKNAACVDYAGSIDYSSLSVSGNVGCVRPALWISIE